MASNMNHQFDQLAERLRRLSLGSEIDQEEQLNQIMEMSYEELSSKVMDFGKAHLGKSFLDMTKETRYMTWFAEAYQGSRKPQHVRFLRFIQLHVEKLEAGKNPSSRPTVATQSKAKAKAKMLQVHLPENPWDESEEEMGMPSEASWDIPHGNQIELNEMQNRMGEVENVLQQVLNLLSSNQSSQPASQ
jgi:hypothetical protein